MVYSSVPRDTKNTPQRPTMRQAMSRGARLHCPACGKGRLFQNYLGVVTLCEKCGEHFGHIRADDIPAYFTIAIVGHVVVSMIVIAVKYDWDGWAAPYLFMPLTVLLTLLLLPVVKGATIAHLWIIDLPEQILTEHGWGDSFPDPLTVHKSRMQAPRPSSDTPQSK